MTRIEDMGFALECEPHPSCGSNSAQADALLDKATTLAAFDRTWRRMARRGETDSWGGAQYRHALSHLYYAHPETMPKQEAAPRSASGKGEQVSDTGTIAEDELDLDEEEFTDETVRAKWSLDGAATLTEAAQKARDFADWLQGLHDQGYVLRDPIADDYGFYYKPETE